MKRTITVLASTPFLLGACGLATQGPPRGHENMMTPFTCTQSMTGPVGDIAAGLATIFVVTDISKLFRWSSSNNAVASVSDAGIVTAHDRGTALVAANADNVIGTANVVVVSAR